MKTKLLSKIRKKARHIYKIANLTSCSNEYCSFDYRVFECGKLKWRECSIISSDIREDLLKFKKETISEIERGLLLEYRKKYYNRREKLFRILLEL